MLQISKNISVSGFENQQQFEKWIKNQNETMPKSVMLKMFKWFLMRLEDNVKENKFNKNVIDAVDKYAIKIIQNKIMKEDDVIKYISLAIEVNEIERKE